MEKQVINPEPVKMFGFFRVQIEDGPTGKIVGDSGWVRNRITNTGMQHYVVQLMIGTTGSSRVTHAALGGGTEAGAADTSLQSEHDIRQTVSSEVSGSFTAHFEATFGSVLSWMSDATSSIQNIGLFATSTQGGGSIFCGQSYANSEVVSNQNVNVTYEIQFATA
jgi:hypothetical protein